MQDIKKGQLLPIHFDLPRHVIPLQTFIVTAENAGRIAEVINQELFGGNFTLEVVIVPPEAGSFLSQLGIVVTAVGIFIAGAIVSGPLGDFGSGIFEEIVSNDASDVGKELVQSVRAAFEELTSSSEDREAKCVAASVVTVAAVKWILQEDNEELEALPMASALKDALVAKRRFYDACKDVPDLKAIGFSDSQRSRSSVATSSVSARFPKARTMTSGGWRSRISPAHPPTGTARTRRGAGKRLTRTATLVSSSSATSASGRWCSGAILTPASLTA